MNSDQVHIEKYSGFDKALITGRFPVLRPDRYRILDIPVIGDAPKDFVRAYFYERDGSVRVSSPKTWHTFIAKIGHKWYPNESITEQLMTRIGEVIGIKMAKSRLAVMDGHLRFFSQHFHNKKERLVHGAEIYAAYLNDKDTTFVQEIEDKNMSRDFFTFEFTEEAIKNTFPDDHKDIMRDFVRMLIFDAWTGNNDRHFYNWGVINHIKRKTKVRFSPVYDTARGLFWNDSEERIVKLMTHEAMYSNYLEKSAPKIGIEMATEINHYRLMEYILIDERFADEYKDIVNKNNKSAVIDVIDTEFKGLFSDNRIYLIKKCICDRFARLEGLISG